MGKRYLGGDIYFEQNENSQEFSEEESGGSSTLAGLTDVDISNPTDGQTLFYNASTEKWENGEGGSGALIAYITEVTSYTPPHDNDPGIWNGKLSITMDEIGAAFTPETARPVFMLWPIFDTESPYYFYPVIPNGFAHMSMLTSPVGFNIPAEVDISAIEIAGIDDDGHILIEVTVN